MAKDPEIQNLLRPISKAYSIHTGLHRVEGAEKMMTEPREEAALRLEWRDQEAQNGADGIWKRLRTDAL